MKITKSKVKKTTTKKTVKPKPVATPKHKFNKGDTVVKLLSIGDITTGSKVYVHSKNKNKDYVSISDNKDSSPYGHPDIHAYHQDSGRAFELNIVGCVTRLITLQEAKDMNVHMEEEDEE